MVGGPSDTVTDPRGEALVTFVGRHGPREPRAETASVRLGIARQRVHQLRSTAAFPAPLAELRGGAVWDAATVRKFARGWERKPGRPAGRTSRRTGYRKSGHLVDRTSIEDSLGIRLTQSDLNRTSSEELSRMLGETK